MKKYFALVLVALFSFVAFSCDDRNDNIQDNDTYSVVLDIKNVNFEPATSNAQYSISRTFTRPLVDTDVVLIYRRAGEENGATVWQSIPRTIYLENGELDYDFDFSKNDIMIYADGTYDLSETPAYLNNQTFRVVLVPASMGSKNATVDYSDYNSVIRHFNIDDTKVKNL